jgi:hypothetical protein
MRSALPSVTDSVTAHSHQGARILENSVLNPSSASAREERELMIAANNGYLLAFDNLSGCAETNACSPSCCGSASRCF